MPENNFEKNVRQKLDELRLKPSPGVWEDVERRIRREKKRRRIIFWLPFLTLLTGAGLTAIYFTTRQNARPLTTAQAGKQPAIAPGGKKAAGEIIITSNKEKQTPAAPAMDLTRQTAAPATQQEKNKMATAKVAPVVQENGKNIQPVTVRRSLTTSVQKSRVVYQTRKPGINKTAAAAPVMVAVKEAPVAGTAATTVDITAPVVMNAEEKDQPPVVKEPVAATFETSKVSLEKQQTDSFSVEKPETPVAPPVAMAAVAVPQPPFRKRIEWGVSFSPSFSQISDALLTVPVGEAKANNMAAVGFSGPPVSNQPLRQADEISFALYDMGFSYQLGVFAQKDIFKRSRIRVGLNYSYYSTNIKGGSLLANSVAVINDFGTFNNNGLSYRYGVQQPYKTRFSFIELPLTYQLRIGKGKNVPLLMHGSVVPGLFTASNMLHYDSTVAGVYFVDNSRLRRFSLSYETGLSIELGKKSKFPVTMGPQMRFGLSNLLKNEYGKRYLISAGLNITVRKRAL